MKLMLTSKELKAECALIPWNLVQIELLCLRCLSLVCVCVSQCVGDRGGSRRRLVGAAYLPPAKGSEAGAVPSCPEEATGGTDEDHGQCGHVLHATHALYIHIQVCFSSLQCVILYIAIPEVQTDILSLVTSQNP